MLLQSVFEQAMLEQPVVFSMFLIFMGAAIFATVALYTRQSLLVVYMVVGGLLGPWGFKFIVDAALIRQTGDIGIIF